MILHLTAHAPLVLRIGASAVLAAHIGAGLIGLASGAVALTVRKGGRLHRLSGTAFVASIMTMATIGGLVSPFLPQRANVVPAIFTFYLAASGWMTVRRREPGVGAFEIAGLALVLGAVAIGVTFGVMAANAGAAGLDGDGPATFLVFSSIAALAAALDVKVILRGGVTGVQRVRRHIWRICLALLIATASLFLGQPKVFPAALRGSPIMFAPELAIMAAMAFWMARAGFDARRKRPERPAPSGGGLRLNA